MSGCCPERPTVTDIWCQNWRTTCGESAPMQIWGASGDIIAPFGTVTILAEEYCDTVEVYINGTEAKHIVGTIVGKEESISVTVGNLRSVYVRCPGDSTAICCGKISFNLHYKRY